jgi:long-chain acyl-CoA synthetase
MQATRDPRHDLLAYLERYRRSGRLSARRADRWRRRGLRGREIANRAERVADTLAAHGVQAGDRVALALNDGPLWHAGFFGTLRAGGVAVPLDLSFEPQHLRQLALDLELRAVCTESEVPDLELGLPQVVIDWLDDQGIAPSAVGWPSDDPERIAEIVTTSGTTGAPQAVPVTHRNLSSVLDSLGNEIDKYRWALRLTPAIRIAVSLPLSHLYGQVMGVFLPPLLGARATQLDPMPAPDLARALRDERAWVLATVPRTLSLLGRYLESQGASLWGADEMNRKLEVARNRPWPVRWAMFAPLRRLVGYRLIAVVSGGGPLETATESLWRALGYVVVQGYGLTETAPLVALNHPFDTAPGSLGKPLPGVEVRIATDGEILVRGANVVAARVGGPAVDDQGWLHTGDLGRWDDRGRLTFLGRMGERIVTTAGVNVDPEPIVAALKRQPGVLDAVVLERPWPPPGAVSAVLVVHPGVDAQPAVTQANRELPDAARVRSWRVWPEPDFPRTRTGKPRRADVREWLQRQAPTSAGTPAARTSVDPFDTIAGMVGDLTGVAPPDLARDTRLEDALSSLDRVELMTQVEMAYGATVADDVFAGDATLAEVAEAIASEPTEGAHAEEDHKVERESLDVRFARWRFLPPVRVARAALQTLIMRPAWHTLFDLDVGGREHVRALAGPALIASNHLSILDPGTVLFALPARASTRIAPAAMWGHFTASRAGWLQYQLAVFGLNLVPLVQSGDWRPTLSIAGAVVDRGSSVLIYPEGERSPDGELLEFRRDVAVMAQELHLPIVPCGIAGTLAVLPRGARWARNCWLRTAPVAIRFGEPLPAPSPKDDLQPTMTELVSRIAVLRSDALRAAGRN